MTKQKQQKARSVPAQKQIGIWPWLRDKMYDVVYSEGDFVLQFVADFFRGAEPAREARHLKRQVEFQASRGQHSSGKNVKKPIQSQRKPLNKAEQKIFVDLLKRKPSEKQIPYWKRKKALLSNPNKRELVMRHAADLKLAAQQKADTIEISASTFSIPHKQKQTVTKVRKR